MPASSQRERIEHGLNTRPPYMALCIDHDWEPDQTCPTEGCKGSLQWDTENDPRKLICDRYCGFVCWDDPDA